jgi:hypothetical protein
MNQQNRTRDWWEVERHSCEKPALFQWGRNPFLDYYHPDAKYERRANTLAATASNVHTEPI